MSMAAIGSKISLSTLQYIIKDITLKKKTQSNEKKYFEGKILPGY